MKKIAPEVSLDEKLIYGFAKYEEGILPNFERIKAEGGIGKS